MPEFEERTKKEREERIEKRRAKLGAESGVLTESGREPSVWDGK